MGGCIARPRRPGAGRRAKLGRAPKRSGSCSQRAGTDQKKVSRAKPAPNNQIRASQSKAESRNYRMPLRWESLLAVALGEGGCGYVIRRMDGRAPGGILLPRSVLHRYGRIEEG